MKEDVIEVANGLYADTKTVISKVVEDLLSTLPISRDDLRGVERSLITVSEGKIYKETWDEDHYGKICDEEKRLVSEDPDDIKRIDTACNLINLYHL